MKPRFEEVSTGERFQLVQNLQDVVGEYPNGLLGLTAVAAVFDARRELLFRFPMQPLSVGQEAVTFVCGGSVTESWVVGELAVMDVLFSNGEDTGRVLTPQIIIEIKEGLSRPQTTGIGTGGFGQGFGDGLNKGASGS